VPVPGVYATAMGDGCGAAGTRVKVTIPSDNIAGATGPAAAGLTFCAGVAGKHVEDSNTYMSFAPTCPAGTQKVGELPGASPPLDVCAGPPSVIGQWPFTLFANEVKCPSGAPPVGTIPFSVMEGPGGGGRAGWFGATLCK
jgi:hypothetical protein